MEEKFSGVRNFSFIGGSSTACWGGLIGGAQMLLGYDPKTAFTIAAVGTVAAILPLIVPVPHSNPNQDMKPVERHP